MFLQLIFGLFMAFATPAHSTASSNDGDTTVISDPGSDTGGDNGQIRPR